MDAQTTLILHKHIYIPEVILIIDKYTKGDTYLLYVMSFAKDEDVDDKFTRFDIEVYIFYDLDKALWKRTDILFIYELSDELYWNSDKDIIVTCGIFDKCDSSHVNFDCNDTWSLEDIKIVMESQLKNIQLLCDS